MDYLGFPYPNMHILRVYHPTFLVLSGIRFCFFIFTLPISMCSHRMRLCILLAFRLACLRVYSYLEINVSSVCCHFFVWNPRISSACSVSLLPLAFVERAARAGHLSLKKSIFSCIMWWRRIRVGNWFTFQKITFV